MLSIAMRKRGHDMVLDTESLENLMACERIKEELKTVEGECARILGRFDQREDEPTAAEREVRRRGFIKIRMELVSCTIGSYA